MLNESGSQPVTTSATPSTITSGLTNRHQLSSAAFPVSTLMSAS